MKYEFNTDQISVIEQSLENQENIWSKSKSSREYYDADLRRLNECLKIIINKRGNNDR
jgi:hypothetical protein|tara:strand:- start:501 stop:674 length:174 start_codon:yes stop_codon:yes gene_type:complete